jgi:hypothetical protein
MSRTTFILAVVYFVLVEFVIILYSPHGKTLFWPAYQAPEVCPLVLPEKQAPDYVGEEIVYDVKMGSMKIGTSVFHHQERTDLAGVDAQLVVFTTDVIQINDTERIWADTKEFLPLRIERDVRMWPKYEQIIESYDQARHILDITKTAGGKQHSLRIVKQGPIHNAILLPYQVRRVDKMSLGWSMKVTLPTQEFEITLKSIEEVTVPAGTFKAFYFESDPRRFAIWISADDRRIPVKIRGSSGLNYTMLMRSYSK